MPFRPNAAANGDNGNNKSASAIAGRTIGAAVNNDGDAGGTAPRSMPAVSASAATAALRKTMADRETAGHFASSTSSANGNPASQRSGPPSAFHGQNDKHNTTRRRQSSIPKVPMGPRAMDFPAGKRSVSNSVLHSNGIHGASAVASQDPYTNELTINDISRFSFASIAPANPRDERDSSEYDNFLEPTFNFDDFHDHITTSEPNLRDFPLPGAARPTPSSNDDSGPDLPVQQPSQPVQSAAQSQPAIPVPARKTSGSMHYSTPLSRKASGASTQSRMSNKSDSVHAQITNTQSILKGRRQSHFPPNAFNNPAGSTSSSKAPRKSIGPGTFVPPDTTKAEGVKRRPSVGGRRPSTESKNGLSLRLTNKKGDLSDGKASRTIRAKSFMGAKSQSSNDLLAPSSPETTRPTSSHVPGTPNRRSGTPGRTTTPGTAGKRMSVMPGHGGLGARTISPTDARRMKRMSIVPPAPPIPHSRISQAPPTPTEPMPTRPRSTVQSPAVGNRKSLTPSSARTTPDPNRKSYSSGQSLSSATSYASSVRNSASLSARLSQNLSSSRLPTPKPRIDTSTIAPLDIGVPPVPAIPKAYESPGSEFDQPFFSARSSSLPPIDSPITSSPQVTNFESAMKTLETPRAPSASSKVSQTIPLEPELRQKPQPKNSKKSNHSLRLPPLNLLPLSTPTAAKIKAFKDARAEAADAPSTPPPYRSTKTPSTPMTASKASFFTKSHRAQEEAVMRSSTSHYALRPDPMLTPANESPSLPPFTFEPGSLQDRGISPFVSSSLPKTDDFANYMRPNFTTELNRTGQAKPNGPRAPSFSVTPKLGSEPSPVERSEGDNSAYSGLRRKLSRKRTDPKSEQKTLEQPVATNYDNMPPPKLPASATWSNNLSSAASPVQKPQTYLRSRRQTSGSSNILNAQRQDSIDSNATHVSTSRPSMESVRSFMQHSNRSGSISSIAAQAKSSPRAPAPPQAQPPRQEEVLDRDDMVAEEEMKRLASKRRDFESAARELDALRARACPARRITAATATQLHTLNIFERGEIVDYGDIYFCGSLRARKIVGDPGNTATNFGYDDDRGDYNIVEGDHLAYRYEVVDLLGKGSFGQVVRCIDHKTGILVAVKIIRNKKRFHQQALVEVNILQKLKEWDPQKKHSVVNFDQSFYFRGHLCISTDLLGMNLYEFIKAHDFRGFSLKLIRRFTKQMLHSLILLQKHKVIHCDLKPENILLAHPVHSEIKVIDFGSSCFENEKVYTYIQSRFYRSPEVILGMSYGMPIDMWSIGCILAELFTGYPIFPGENEQEQLACIMEVFGPPEKHLIEKSSRKKLFFDSMGKPRLTVSSKGRRRRPSSKDLRQALKCDDEAFLDFIARCLRWDPSRRMRPDEAVRHEFITGVKSAALNTQVGARGSQPVLPRVATIAQTGRGPNSRTDLATAAAQASLVK
ncbi:Dual specificity protein kinase pom1 [Cyphellophora attinorum]|uniref:Dual specificity protein kinase pom1 n=1 Tax=Cyphellophora attinorum TaxID=1664694 RepID=A0A0N1HDQ9_9EURO|nr:Dual specificity protein kinase pom1 [Phialophora attinorum]KPI43220.1 Dual specificity protein kinase pom1 [Phialophora attinorum]